MQLHHLKPSHARTYAKTRVGRGGKRGTTSGHGTKGQKSRAGHRIRPAERDLIQRLPKLRGFKNKPLHKKPAVINLGDLEKFSGTAVTAQELHKQGFVGVIKHGVKILGGGTAKTSLNFFGVSVSASARKKIEEAGGRIESRK